MPDVVPGGFNGSFFAQAPDTAANAQTSASYTVLIVFFFIIVSSVVSVRIIVAAAMFSVSGTENRRAVFFCELLIIRISPERFFVHIKHQTIYCKNHTYMIY